MYSNIALVPGSPVLITHACEKDVKEEREERWGKYYHLLMVEATPLLDVKKGEWHLPNIYRRVRIFTSSFSSLGFVHVHMCGENLGMRLVSAHTSTPTTKHSMHMCVHVITTCGFTFPVINVSDIDTSGLQDIEPTVWQKNGGSQYNNSLRPKCLKD